MNRRFLLVRRPRGEPVPEDFRLAATPVPEPAAGMFIMRNHFASLDPAQRGWMDETPSYMPPIPLGQPVRATTVGRVHRSANPDFAPGDWVLGLNALEDYSLVAPGGFTTRVDVSKLPSPSYLLSAMGAVGLTGYFGLLEVGRPQPGETVLVTGAAGAVGSVVGQIARIKGCRTIGIAGGPAKCQRLLQDYHFDVAIDYRGKTARQLSAEIAAAARDGVDIIFENVGGDILDAGLMNLAPRARVILCGLISEYNSAARHGARNIWQLIVKRATMHGFLIMDYVPRFAAGGAQIAAWIGEGRLRIDEHIERGLENAYPAFMKLFSGGNNGKMVLQIA
ncbi:MAG TPA: NADP-dependent oxidoreductase [Steroidobacteraceae bacterium]|nr:NADP-dependent oxidoreductase [Steroidobacteraceae bacterium]